MLADPAFLFKVGTEVINLMIFEGSFEDFLFIFFWNNWNLRKYGYGYGRLGNYILIEFYVFFFFYKFVGIIHCQLLSLSPFKMLLYEEKSL